MTYWRCGAVCHVRLDPGGLSAKVTVDTRPRIFPRVVVELGELDLAIGEVGLAVVARREVHQADGHRCTCLLQPALLQTLVGAVVLPGAQRVVEQRRTARGT